MGRARGSPLLLTLKNGRPGTFNNSCAGYTVEEEMKKVTIHQQPTKIMNHTSFEINLYPSSYISDSLEH